MIRLLKYGTVGGIVATGVSLYLPQSKTQLRKVSEKFSVAAKSEDVDPIQNSYQGGGTKWDNNWDCREPTSLVKPLKENASDEEKAKYEEKLKAASSKASRILVLVRHGQYNLAGQTDQENYLTELGRQQADVTGERLALLYARYLRRTDEAEGTHLQTPDPVPYMYAPSYWKHGRIWVGVPPSRGH